MSYQLYDINGYVGDIATTQGWEDLSNYILKFGMLEMKDFVNKGFIEISNLAIVRFERLKPKDVDVKITLDNLILLLNKCEDVAIISDGLTLS
jgi:hypothetical protein